MATAMVEMRVIVIVSKGSAEVRRRSRRPGTKANARVQAIKHLLQPRYVVSAFLASGLAFLAGAHSLAQVTKRTVITVGAVGQHANGRLFQAAGSVRFGQKIQNPDQVISAARQTMAIAPLSAASASLIGLALDQKGNKVDARKAMNVAIQITRRDPTAQLWLGQEAIAKGEDLELIMRRFDLIMRTQPQVRPSMFAALAQTLVNNKMRGALEPYVRDDNAWFEGFALTAAEKSSSAVGFARLLLQQSNALPDSVSLRHAYASTLRQVVAERQFQLAGRLYGRLPDAQRDGLQTAAFPNQRRAEYPPATWWLVTEPGIGSSMSGSGVDRALEVYAANGAGGLAARKLLLLRPGAYHVRWRLFESSNNPGARIRVSASCADATGDRLIAERSIDVVPPENLTDVNPAVTAHMDFTVPTAGCLAVWLDIRPQGGKGRDESRWLLSNMSIAPLRAGFVSEAVR